MENFSTGVKGTIDMGNGGKSCSRIQIKTRKTGKKFKKNSGGVVYQRRIGGIRPATEKGELDLRPIVKKY